MTKPAAAVSRSGEKKREEDNVVVDLKTRLALRKGETRQGREEKKQC